MLEPAAKSVSSTLTIMSEVMTPNDANFFGKVFGGRILSLVDLCAYVTSARFSGYVCVTASFDGVDFHEPIEVGEVVTLTGYVSYVGRTSMEITIEVHAENVLENLKRHTNTARVTMVALKEGRPVQVPRLICQTREDKIRFLLGRDRRIKAGGHKSEREAFRGTLEGLNDDQLERLIQES